MRLESQRIGAENEKYEIIAKNTFLFSIINHEVIEALNVSPLPWGQGRSPVEVGRQQPGIGIGIVIGVGHNLDRSLAQWDGGHIVGAIGAE